MAKRLGSIPRLPFPIGLGSADEPDQTTLEKEMTNEEKIALERVQQEINAPAKREHVGKPLLKWLAKAAIVTTLAITVVGVLTGGFSRTTPKTMTQAEQAAMQTAIYEQWRNSQ